MTPKELREKRASVGAQIRQLAEKANKENRDFNSEEKGNWEQVNADYNAMTRQIEIAERAAFISDEGTAPAPVGREDVRADGHDNDERRGGKPDAARDESLAIAGWMLRQSGRDISEEHEQAAKRSKIRLGSPELVMRFGDVLKEQRAIGDNPQTVTTTGGGYLRPTGFSNQLEVSMKAFNPLDSLCTPLITASGEQINWPTVDDTSQAGEMIAINTEVAEGQQTFGNVQFDAYKGSSKIVIVPAELMQDSAFDLTTWLASSLAERLGRLRATQTTTGTGSSAPNGIVTASGAGVTAASTTAFTADEILGLIHSVDPAYRKPEFNFGLMCHDNILLATRKLKDGNSRYIWEQNTQVGQPDQIFGVPVYLNQAMDSALTTGKKVFLAGAFKKFVIRTVGEIRIKRLVERYAEKDQEGWVAFIRFDSDLLDAGTDPVKRLALA